MTDTIGSLRVLDAPTVSDGLANLWIDVTETMKNVQRII